MGWTEGWPHTPFLETTKITAFLTQNLRKLFLEVAKDLRLFSTRQSCGPLIGAVSAQKAFQGSETRELQGRPYEKGVSTKGVIVLELHTRWDWDY